MTLRFKGKPNFDLSQPCPMCGYMLCHRNHRVHVATIELRILWLVPKLPVADTNTGMRSDCRYIAIPVPQVGWRSTLAWSVRTDGVRFRRCPARELARRGEAWGTSEARQMLEHAMETGRGDVYLRLTSEQYSRLRRT
jgi:hypothetical protein